MAREIVFLALSVLLCGSVTWTLGWFTPKALDRGSAARLERRRWVLLMRPILAAAVVLSALVGWFVVEPAHAEPLPWTFAAGAGAVAAIWMRAGVRALHVVSNRGRLPLAATVGLLRPRVYVSQVLERALDAEELAAASAHEEAHARHGDPLRILLAQLATDLQWPCPAAAERFRAWLAALEVARDDEARRDGVDGAALATAILTTVRLETDAAAPPAAALLTGDEIALRERISRLLSPIVEEAAVPTKRRWLHWLPIPSACVMGVAFGEIVIGLALRAVP